MYRRLTFPNPGRRLPGTLESPKTALATSWRSFARNPKSSGASSTTLFESRLRFGENRQSEQSGNRAEQIGVAAGAAHSMLVKDDIVAESLELVAHAAALAVPRAFDGIRGHAGFGSVLHPSHAVAVGIREAHPRPARENEHQVGWYRLVVFVSVHDLEGLGEGQEMRTWIRSSDPAHATEVGGAQDVAGDVPAEEPRLRLGETMQRRDSWLMLAEGHLTRVRFSAMLRRIALLPLPAN